MKHILYRVCAFETLSALVLLAAWPRTATPQTIDDSFLLKTSVTPNAVLFIDNSKAMNQIEWHPAFDPDTFDSVAAGCTDFDDDVTYDTTTLGGSETHCGNTRTLFAPNNPTDWDGRYLNWYFSDLADPYIAEIESAVVETAGCNQAGSQTRFVSQYRRTRADAARQVFLDVLCLSEPRGLRFGLASFRAADDAAGVDPNGGYMSVAINDPSPSHAANLEAKIGNTKLDAAKPLSETLFQLYTYLMPRDSSALPVGQDDATQFPEYVYDLKGDVPSNPSKVPPDPVEFACQKNFIVIVTTGTSSYDTFDRDPLATSQGYQDFTALIGDYYDEGDTEVPGGLDEATLYLDDIAKYAQESDLRPDFAGTQSVDTYMIGFNTSNSEDAFLERVAEVGNGLFFSTQDGSQLAEALLAVVNDIVEKSRSFTAATVPSARTADGGDFYNSFFLPSGKTAFWEGHLRSWHFSAAGEVLDSNGDCALVDPDGAGECNNGPFQAVCQSGQTSDCVVPFWDAGEQVPPPGDANGSGTRQLYTSLLDGGAPAMSVRADLDQNLDAADLDVAPFTAPPAPDPNSPLYPIKGSSAINEEGLADEVVAYARGCFFGTGVSSNVSQPTSCEARPWLLGDVFHSDPIAVRHPLDRTISPAYSDFRNAYLARDRVIYMGTNGGFLEAIHAGDWDSVNQTYDEGTGTELFGFMPWEPRLNIKRQPIDAPTARTHYVDGPPQVSDVWLYDTPTNGSQAAADWRTLLVGGLRGGGRHYYALDVTNPSGIVGPAGNLPYPGYMWEFPSEPGYLSGSGDYLDMGETWGTPVLTRVRVRVGANDNGGVGFERWVAIVTAGYDATSDPNPSTVDPNADYDGVASPPSTRGRGVYILDLKTGEVLAEQKLATNGDLEYALAATPSVIDLDADSFADVIYLADLGGNLWKWVVHDIGDDRINDSSSLRTQPSWPFTKFFQASTDTIDGDVYYKNFFQPPAAAYIGGTLWLAFGSGERAAIGFEGVSGEDENNRFYAITDPDPLGLAGVPAVVTEADLTDVTTTGTPVTSGRGYYFKVDDGEKFVTQSVIFAGKVVTATFTPSQVDAEDADFDPCTQRGGGELYVFDLATGRGDFTDDSDNETRSVSIGSGLPTDPKVSIGVGGSNNKIVIQKSGTDIEVQDTVDVNSRGIIYWREVH